MTEDGAGRKMEGQEMMSPNQAQYIEILANRTAVGQRLEDGIKAVLGETPREMVTREEASRVIAQLKELQKERRRQRETERNQ